MLLTVSEYKTITGQTGAEPTDPAIKLALNRYSALVEDYIGREMGQSDYEETFLNCVRGPIQVKRYPISEIASIVVDGEDQDIAKLSINYSTGSIFHDGLFFGKDAVVSYTGGNSSVPYAIKVVVATLANGYLSGLTGGLATLRGGVKETVFGVASVEYPSSLFQTNKASSAEADPFAELGEYVTVLARYREPGLA